jgi:DNA-binding Xre family transcriptional regulator
MTLAEKSNVARSVIARFETGRTVISTRNLARICQVLGCRMEDVLKEESNGKAG